MDKRGWRCSPHFSLMALIAIALSAGCSGTGRRAATPRIELSPDTLLVGNELQIHLKRIPSGKTVTLHAQRLVYLYPNGETWHYSYATFTPGDSEVDLGTDPPQSGTYEVAEVRGLLWSMQPVLDEETVKRFRAGHPALTPREDLSANSVVLDLEVGSTIVDTERLLLTTRVPGLVVKEVHADNLHGIWAHPDRDEPLPGIMVLGGSEGGVRGVAGFAEALASNGYSVLALAYFRDQGLPSALVEIPIEYMERALFWLSEQSETHRERLAVIGMSKGAEAALLLASNSPRVDAVIAYAPSSVVWQSPVDPTKSSWTIDGKPVPFVSASGVSEADFERTMAADSVSQRGERPASYHIAQVVPEQYRRAAIPIERSSASILLISGGRDRVWHSLEMGEEIVARLRESGFDHGVEHLTFPEAGHGIAGLGMRPSAANLGMLGGSPEANAHAQYDGWRGVLRFLEDNLQGSPRR